MESATLYFLIFKLQYIKATWQISAPSCYILLRFTTQYYMFLMEFMWAELMEFFLDGGWLSLNQHINARGTPMYVRCVCVCVGGGECFLCEISFLIYRSLIMLEPNLDRENLSAIFSSCYMCIWFTFVLLFSWCDKRHWVLHWVMFGRPSFYFEMI